MITVIAFVKKIFDPANFKYVLMIGSVIFLLMFLQTCNQNSKLKAQIATQQLEQQRISNNLAASKDTLKQVVMKNGTLVASISGYEITQKELANQYADLFSSMKDFKDQWSKTPPKSIVETRFTDTGSVKYFDFKNTQNGENGVLNFSSDSVFTNGNSRSVSGSLKYSLAYFNKKDSSLVKFPLSPLYAKVSPYQPDLFIKQSMNINTGINRDPKTGKSTIWVTTDYPGVVFTKVTGAEIIDPITAPVQPRRAWGLGVSFGPQLMYNKNGTLTPGFGIGMGLNFTPKKLQV